MKRPPRNRRPNKIANRASYFFGCLGVGAGVAGTLFVGTGVDAGVLEPFTVSRTEVPLVWREDRIESEAEVNMNTITATVVARESAEAAPRGPKAVWLPTPPNAPAMSALLPLCSSTTMIRNRQTTTCTIVKVINSILL